MTLANNNMKSKPSLLAVACALAAALFWRAGYFKNVEEPKYRMMDDDGGRRMEDK